MTREFYPSDIGAWNSRMDHASKRKQFDRTPAEAVFSAYQDGTISRYAASRDIDRIIAGQAPIVASSSTPTLAHTSGGSALGPAPSAPQSVTDPDNVDKIFRSAGYGQQPESESAKVATILQHHREVTGISSRRDEEVVEGIFRSAGYPTTGTTPAGNLTAEEQAHVGKILANQYAVTGIKSRSQAEQDRADAAVVDRAFQSAGYAPKAHADDPIVQRALANQRAVTGRWKNP